MIIWIILLLISLLLAIVLVGMVLLQPSKGGGMTSAFGSLGTSLGSTFGSRRTLDFLSKATVWVATAIGLLCLLANLMLKSMLGGGGGTGIDNVKSSITPQATQQAPATGAAPQQVPQQGAPQATQPPPAGQQQSTTPPPATAPANP